MPAVGTVVAGAAAAIVIVHFVTPSTDRRWLLTTALLALLARDVVVGAIDVGLLLRGGAIAYAPDEALYVRTASAIASHWRDPAAAFDQTDPFITSDYVLTIARIFFVIGPNVVVVKLLNTWFALTAAILAYRAMMALGLGGARWAGTLLLVFPSLVFWSALALKDAYVVFFLVASLWAASEWLRNRNPGWIIATAALLMPLASVRAYIFIIASLAWIAAAVALRTWRARLVGSTAITVVVIAMFAATNPFPNLGINPFFYPIMVRSTAAQGAGSAFVEAAPVVRGQAGDRFVITVPNQTPAPDTTPRLIEVAPGTQLVTGARATRPPDATGPSPVLVRPGDIIVIRPTQTDVPTPPPAGSASPTPTPAPAIAIIRDDVDNKVGLIDNVATSVEGSIRTNLSFLPFGMLFTLTAPFPWTARTLEQFATIPEMLLWYLIVLAALAGVVSMLARRDLRFAQGLTAGGGIFVILSLIEANAGTLVRSRDMLIPYVVILAAVGFEQLASRSARLRATLDRLQGW
jgi:hypothetical protein